ncbi:hypothetical protein BBJ28_00011484 [Nothophytophthora sp. Chile5]|nr:hypothetical protein BBJ28_00011484 [Nothophytophthora sp. Chile5]
MTPPRDRPMFAMLCANNVNRSTEAHDHLHAAGLRVCSFGAGNKVRFPGPSRDDPRIYEFFTPYETMYTQLKAENADLYVNRWQDLSVRELQGLDVVLCFDDRIFEIVLEDLQLRGAAGGPGGPGNELTLAWRPLHLLCLDTKDTPEHAKVGGSLALELCQSVRLYAVGPLTGRFPPAPRPEQETLAYSQRVCAQRLLDFNPQLGTLLFRHPVELLPLFHAALAQEVTCNAGAPLEHGGLPTIPLKARRKLKVRIEHLPPVAPLRKPAISAIRSNDVKQLVQIAGTVVRTGMVLYCYSPAIRSNEAVMEADRLQPDIC